MFERSQMPANSCISGAARNWDLKGFNPRECEHARPYMVDNGVLDIYLCKKFKGNCYFEPNGGPQFKKICE